MQFEMWLFFNLKPTLTVGSSDVTVRLVMREAGEDRACGSHPETLQTSREAVRRCSISYKLMRPLPKRLNSCEADLPPSWHSPPPTPRASNPSLCDMHLLVVMELSMPDPGPSRPRSVPLLGWRERCGNDVVLLTGNIRQQRPLQINVQQVLGV